MKFMRTTFAAATIALIGAAALPASAQDDTSGAGMRAVVCAQALGFAQGVDEARIVVAPRGAGNVRLDKVSAGSSARNFAIGVFDINTCDAVQVPIWVQDDAGNRDPQGTGPVVNFTKPALPQGYYEVRSDRSVDRDLGYAIRNTAQ